MCIQVMSNKMSKFYSKYKRRLNLQPVQNIENAVLSEFIKVQTKLKDIQMHTNNSLSSQENCMKKIEIGS